MKLSKLLIYFVPTFGLLYYVWSGLQESLFVFTHFSVICSLLVVAWTLAYFLYERSNTEEVSPIEKAVLITGCDCGFGHQLALNLAQYGFYVFAAVLFPDGEGAQSLQHKYSSTLRVIRMDVTKQDEVESAVQEIQKSGKKLWAVVNNAGIGSSIFWDWGNDVDEFKKLFEVNVFGLVRVTKCCVPLLRESNGRIVNVSSIAGRLTLGCMSHYAMAKHSVRVFSDCLRHDFMLNSDAIDVITIEPSYYKTGIREVANRTRERVLSQTPDTILQAYNIEACKRMFAELQYFEDKLARTNLNEVVDAMASGVVLKHPKLFYRCASYLDVVSWALSHAPEVLIDGIMYLLSKQFSIK